jgi:hypothetical protein
MQQNKHIDIANINSEAVGFREASVVQIDNDQYFINADNQTPQPAHIATSCLVKPQVGDHVCYWHNQQGTNYIISVLSSLDSAKVEINLTATNIAMQASNNLKLHSNDIELQATKKTTQISQELAVSANESTFKLAKSHFIGKESQVNLDIFRFIGQQTMQVVALMTQQCEKYIRQVSEIDSVKASNMLRSITKLFSLKSHNSIMKAKQDMAITAKKINMSD